MDVLDLLVFILLIGGGWLWLDSLKVRERAVAASKAACDSEGLLLLDDTVAIKALGLKRNDDGQLLIRRLYNFEYSNTGNNRCAGNVLMLGSRVLLINLNRPDTDTDIDHDEPAAHTEHTPHTPRSAKVIRLH